MNKNFDVLAEKSVIDTTISALSQNGFLPEFVNTGAQALEKIKQLIPVGASIMNGSSTTLNQIGYVDYLKEGTHSWNNLHENILKETDKVKQAELRKESVTSDFYLGSVHAVTADGKLIIASASGSQLPHLVFTSQNLILVVGTQKIVTDLNVGLERIRDYVFPLENNRMKDAGMGGSVLSKELILHSEPGFMGRKVHIIFVNEVLGF